jgi:hypothetical protein
MLLCFDGTMFYVVSTFSFADEVWNSKMIGAAENGLCNRIAFTEGWRTSAWKELGTVKTVSEHTASYRGRPAEHSAVTETEK